MGRFSRNSLHLQVLVPSVACCLEIGVTIASAPRILSIYRCCKPRATFYGTLIHRNTFSRSLTYSYPPDRDARVRIGAWVLLEDFRIWGPEAEPPRQTGSRNWNQKCDSRILTNLHSLPSSSFRKLQWRMFCQSVLRRDHA